MIYLQKDSFETHAISLPCSHITRTQSEARLCETTASAESQDLYMYQRIVNGIREKKIRRPQYSLSYQPRREYEAKTQKSIDNIIRYRHKNLNLEKSSSNQYDSYSIGYAYDDTNCSEHKIRNSDSEWFSSQEFSINRADIESSTSSSSNSLTTDEDFLEEDEIFSMDL